jgi:hypothetical protein
MARVPCISHHASAVVAGRPLSCVATIADRVNLTNSIQAGALDEVQQC